MSILLSTPSFQTSTGVINNPEDSTITKALESSTLIMIMLASTCLNSVTMFVILRTRSLRQTGHALLILNLCLADLGVVFLGMSFSLLSVFDGGRFLMSHPMICKYLNGFLTLTFSVTGFVLISCIAVDRLLLIVFALRFPPTRRRIYVMVAVAWLTGLSITTIRLLGTGRGFGYLPSTENCAGPYGDIIGTKRYLIVAGAVLMSMFIIVYGTITFYLWKGDQRLLRHTLARPKPVVKPKPPVDENGPNEIQMDSQISPRAVNMETSAHVVMETLSSDPLEKSDDDEDGRSTDDVAMSGTKVTVKRKRQIHLKHRRVTKMTALMISASCICWTPSLLYHADLTWVTDAHWFGVFAMWLAYCHTLADTLIYALMNRRVRAEMSRMARKAKSEVFGMCRR